MKTSKQKIFILFLISTAIASILPFLLNVLGVDFGVTKTMLSPDALAAIPPGEMVDVMHGQLRGSFVHTLLEWSAFTVAIFTVMLAFLHFSTHKDIVTLIVGMTLFFSGCMDAFHTLAANRLISAVADNRDLIPFTWAICRVFNAAIMIAGVTLVLTKRRILQTNMNVLLGVNVIFALVAYGIIHLCATSQNLPQTQFPNSLITRPYDVVPLVLFLFAGLYLYPKLYRKTPNIFTFSLIISAIPEVVVEMHMAFGSSALFDNNFNIAHFLKIIAYVVPLCGLGIEYLFTNDRLKRNQIELKERTAIMIQAEKMSSVGTMAAGVSHELNNPLMGIINYVDYCLVRTDESDKRHGILKNALKESKRCASIIGDLLMFSRTGKIDDDAVALDCSEILDKVISLNNFRISKESIEVTRHTPDIPLRTVKVKGNQIQQVFVNLLGNAVDALENSSVKKLDIHLFEENNLLTVEFSDSGTGIDPEVMDNLFDPFVTSKEAGKGTGLGLSISRTIIENHGGKITCANNMQGGASFTVTLPFTDP